MSKRHLRSTLAGWIIGLFLVSLILAACGSAAQPTSEVSTTAVEIEETADVSADTQDTETATEEAAVEEKQAAAEEQETVAETEADEPAPSAVQEAECQPANPDEDPIAGITEYINEYIDTNRTNDAIAAVSDSDWARGPADAPVTIIEYGDFQCPACASISPVVEGLKLSNGDDVRVVYRHFPLISIHDKAQITAEAAEAAGDQDKFWEMHDLLYGRQPEWSGIPKADIIDTLVGYAEEIGIEDINRFRNDLENGTYTDKIMADYTAAGSAGLSGTPSFVINQLDYPTQSLGMSFEALSLFTKMTLLKSQDKWQWYQQPEQVIDPDKEYVATIKTENGNIVIELFPNTAPVNVNSFAFLAGQGWYKDITFHRVLPDFMAQGGDPIGLGFGFPGYRCGDEVTPERAFDGPGVVALANSGPNTNGGQFFITYDTTPNLSDGFTIIGQVIEGQDVAESISLRDPQRNPTAPPGDKIIDIIVTEK